MMPHWYYIAAYLTALVPDAPFPFTLKMLANRMGVDEETALQMVDEWLKTVGEARRKDTEAA